MSWAARSSISFPFKKSSSDTSCFLMPVLMERSDILGTFFLFVCYSGQKSCCCKIWCSQQHRKINRSIFYLIFLILLLYFYGTRYRMFLVSMWFLLPWYTYVQGFYTPPLPSACCDMTTCLTPPLLFISLDIFNIL